MGTASSAIHTAADATVTANTAGRATSGRVWRRKRRRSSGATHAARGTSNRPPTDSKDAAAPPHRHSQGR